MFGRQWFPESNQIGLTSCAISAEYHLNRKEFDDALKLVDKIYKLTSDEFYCQRMRARIRWLSNRKKGHERRLKVYYSNFWPDHNDSNSQLNDLIETATGQEIVSVLNNEDADISIISCYGNDMTYNAAGQSLKILFLGENVRPLYRFFDLSISSDIQVYRGRNIYLPLWMLEIDWFGKSYPDRLTHPKHLITQDRVINMNKKKSAVVYVGNNAEPGRYSIINVIKDSGIPIDIFGSHSNPIDDKISLYSQYKLVLCPENSMSPGYITEKPLHAWLSGTRYLYSCYPINHKLENNELCIKIAEDWEHQGKLIGTITKCLNYDSTLQVPSLYSKSQLDHLFSSLLYVLRTKLAQFL